MRPDDPRHGTYKGYVAFCRCAPCRQANRDYKRQWRAQSSSEPLPIDSSKHGTPGGFNEYGCRCDRCRAAWYRSQASVYLHMAERLEGKRKAVTRG